MPLNRFWERIVLLINFIPHNVLVLSDELVPLLAVVVRCWAPACPCDCFVADGDPLDGFVVEDGDPLDVFVVEDDVPLGVFVANERRK